LRRRLVVLIGALVTVAGAGSALGVNAGVKRAARLPEGAVVPVVAPGPAPEAVPETVVAATPMRRSKKDYIDGILGRNIFDPDAIGKVSEGGGGDTNISDLDVRLIGTIVAIPELYSSALMAEASAAPRGYGIGDKVQDAEVIKIEPDKVHVKRSNGEIQIITMGGTEAAKPASAAGAPVTGGTEEGIEQISETKFVIERSLYERYMGDLDAISRMGRAIPHRGADGEIDGYRLSGVRRDSLGSQIGIKNGDIIHAVNGKPLISMKDALDALGTLQSESAFQFDVTRRGQKVTLEYEVR